MSKALVFVDPGVLLSVGWRISCQRPLSAVSPGA
jgi:hypothetical protein